MPSQTVQDTFNTVWIELAWPEMQEARGWGHVFATGTHTPLPKSSHARCCPFPEHTVHLHASRPLFMVFIPSAGILSPFLLISHLSGEHLVKAHNLCEAILDPLRGKTHFPLWFPRASGPLANTAKHSSRGIRICVCWMDGQMTGWTASWLILSNSSTPPYSFLGSPPWLLQPTDLPSSSLTFTIEPLIIF